MSIQDTDYIGITTTLPIEVILASGAKPLDLNNVFISGEAPGNAVFAAERYGFPNTSCSWIKGIFTAVKQNNIGRVIGVTGGDCSNTIALMETLAEEGIEIIPFEYPFDGSEKKLDNEINSLCERLSVTRTEAEKQYEELADVRKGLFEIDRLTWEEGKVTGRENFDLLLAASDMYPSPEVFAEKVREVIEGVNERKKNLPSVRLGLAGVPPVFSDPLFSTVVELGGDIVYNEIPRQFAMLCDAPDILSAYSRYTYPYGIKKRLKDITNEAKKRKLDGIIHYVQSFCYRAIEDIIFRKNIDIPVLTLEGDKPGQLSAQARLRLEVFTETIINKSRVLSGE